MSAPLQPPKVPTSFSTPGLPAGELAIGLCKIKLPPYPPLFFSLPFKIPSIPPKILIPLPPLPAISLLCIVINPLQMPSLPGGGRVSNSLSDPDDDWDSQSTSPLTVQIL